VADLDVFQDYTKQAYCFAGIIMGYDLASGLPLESICYGPTFAISNADLSTESEPIDRDLVMTYASLVKWVEEQIAIMDTWRKVTYQIVTDDMELFCRDEEGEEHDVTITDLPKVH
jgi:hypothetical protein